MAEYQRSGYKIKLNHSNALPRYMISLAVECTKESVNVTGTRTASTFKSASVVFSRLAAGKFIIQRTESFTSVKLLWAAIFEATRPNYTTWLVGHNVLPALILCGLPHVFAHGELTIDKPRSKRKREDNDEENVHQAGLAVIEGPPTIIGCRVSSTQGRVVIVDLLNWFSGSISAIESATGIANPENSDVGGGGNTQRSDCERAAVSTLQIFTKLISWVRDNDMGMFRYTASAQAMGAYRHRFMRSQIYVHDNKAVQKLERRAYYGGRSEAFKLGEFGETVFQLDTTALFPSVMRGGFFPSRLIRSEQRAELSEVLPSIDWSRACADVELYTDKPIYPFRTDTNVIYPVGSFVTSLSGEELYSAYRDNAVYRCGSWSEYEVAPLFEVFVEELWQMRQSHRTNGDLLYEQFTKRIMNSLYGKFGQLTPAWVNAENDWSMLPWTTESRQDNATGEWVKYRSIGWQIQRKADREERPQSFYAVAAFITAAARQRMNWLRRVAGKPHVYYQGVDSLIVNKRGYDNLVESGEVAASELGKLRLEYQSDYGRINGISDYQIGSKVVLSSRALNSEINDLGEVVQYRKYIMDNLFKNGPINTIEECAEPWSRHSKYSKGTVGQDGWVKPFVLSGSPISASEGVGSPDAAAAASCSNSGKYAATS